MRISDVEKFESRIENMNLAIARLEQQMIEVWNPTPTWVLIQTLKSYFSLKLRYLLKSTKRHQLI